MIEFEEYKIKLQDYKVKLQELKEAICYNYLVSEIFKLENQITLDDFWNNLDNSQQILQKISQYKIKKNNFDNLLALYEDILILIELANEEEDISLLNEINIMIKDFENLFEIQHLEILLNGPHDNNNAILTFHAGAGGTEAQDWNKMLIRLYTRWGEKHGFKVSVIDFLYGDGAGY